MVLYVKWIFFLEVVGSSSGPSVEPILFAEKLFLDTSVLNHSASMWVGDLCFNLYISLLFPEGELITEHLGLQRIERGGRLSRKRTRKPLCVMHHQSRGSSICKHDGAFSQRATKYLICSQKLRNLIEAPYLEWHLYPLKPPYIQYCSLWSSR